MYSIIIIVFAIIIAVKAIYDIVVFRKEAQHWWNNLSHYGRYILIERYLNVNENSYLPSNDEIRYLYKLHKQRKQL